MVMLSQATPRPLLARVRWRGQIVEAAVLVCLASLCIRLLPFRWTVRIVEAASSRRAAPGLATPEMRFALRNAVNRAAALVPWNPVCFQRGVALHLMLRRRRLPSFLHYGVSHAPEGALAHVWVSLAGEILIGGEEAAPFACLLTIPAAA
jgi:hypothetical protein